MNQIHRDRLLKLADFLDALPAARFDYESWVGSMWEGKLDLSCGTTACAFGWATAVPEFKTLGLSIQKAPEDGLPGVCVGQALSGEDAWSMSCRAARSAFGLTSKQTSDLFTPSSDDPSDFDETETHGSDGKPFGNALPQTVAQHIRDYVAELDTSGEPQVKGNGE